MSSLRPTSFAAVNDWWAQELGVNASELSVEQGGVQIAENALLPGILAYRRGPDVRVAAALGKLEEIQEAMIGRSLQQIFSAAFWPKYLPQFSGNVIGPASLFYADKLLPDWAKIAAPRGVNVRGLAISDAVPFAEFAASLSEEEREHSGLDFSPRAMWGAFVEKQLVAAASYDVWPGCIAHIGVAVHPEFRRRKIGQAVALAAAKGALARRRIVQYRALQSQEGSIGIALKLGLELFAETIYVRPPER